MSHQTVTLSVNLAGGSAGLAAGECNDGGSTICWSPTRGCGQRPMTCVGTSSKPPMLAATVSDSADELDKLHAELAEVLSKYLGGGSGK